MADVIWAEDLEKVADELVLSHGDFDRLQAYVSLVRSYPMGDGDTKEYIRENLKKWIDWEEESYYGEHDTPEDFARFYYDNYSEEQIPSWIVVDWEATWDNNLRHDFYFESNATGGYVWAEVY